MDKFEAAYSTLNPRQKEAVDAIEGPVMVIAGPGTGKTQILTLRIANILSRTDTPPENILALTFTEAAAANMRKRLADLIGAPGYYVDISTFHGFANRVIQEYPERFPAIIGGRNATEIDQIAILREIIETGEFEQVKPFGDPFFYVTDILAAIRDVKHEGLDPDAFRELLHLRRREFEATPDLHHAKGAHAGAMKLEHQRTLRHLEKNAELAGIYTEYEKRLRAAKLYDFEDMILEVIRAFDASKDFLMEVQERVHYILVDEHQDTNGAQNRLLELLSDFHDDPNLFVVGDEKQAIFRFQGASLENFLYFKNKYGRARLISLEENYRSTQSILDSAESVIRNNASTIHAPLTAASHGLMEQPIRLVTAETPEAEHLFIVKRIEELITAGDAPEEIAVIYRENREAEPIAMMFERYKVPFAIESDRNILADPDINKFLKLLEAVDSLGSEERLAEALHIDFLGVAPLDVWRLLQGRMRNNYISLYALATDPGLLDSLGLEDPQKVGLVVKRLEEWKGQSKNQPFLQFFEELVRNSGFLKHVLTHEGSFEKLGKLNTLFEEVKQAVGNRGDYTLGDFLAYLKILREHRVTIRARAQHVPHSVRLMTAHRAKGLEFDYVFLAGAVDGKWGNKRRVNRFQLPFTTAVDISELEKNEDERRLFYMALTRARKMVWITRSERSAEGKELVPSQFLAEIRPEMREELRAEAEAEAVREMKDLHFRERHPSLPRLDDKTFIRELFRERGFSVTALNNYLDCPWKYFYSNLLRLPQTETAYQMYGTAVHRALERFWNAKGEGGEATRELLLAKFEESLRMHPLPEKDLRAILKKGRTALGAYYDNYAPTWSGRVMTEYSVRGLALTEDIVLTGKLDKLEIQNNPDEVVVVDYKVKQPESRNWIEGRTANSTGDYKRQLVFYKLLLDLQGKFRMRAAAIDFVEPNDRGKFKREEFDISGEEVSLLKKEVLRVAGEILDLAFWDKGCGKKDCEYCALRQMAGA